MGPQAKDRRLEPRKRSQILRAAQKSFLDLGYERASADAIAARARVSKATVYNHFDGKKSLFAACVKTAVDELHASALAACVPPAPSSGVEGDLRVLAERFLRLLLYPPVGTLHVMIVTEARRFPELGRTLYENGYKRVRNVLAQFLKDGVPAGALRLDDPDEAATSFLWLCIGQLKLLTELRVMPSIGEDEIRKAAQRGVAVFLRAYKSGP